MHPLVAINVDIGKDSNKKHTDAYDIGALAFVSSVSAPHLRRLLNLS
jgi:hypothetical protein